MTTASSHGRIGIERRRLRVCVFVVAEDRLVADNIFDSGEDVTIGAGGTLLVEAWAGPTLLLISGDRMLHLQPGMRLHMCHDDGEDRVQGTFEELTSAGMTFPLQIVVSKLNITLRKGVSLFAKYFVEEPP